MFLAGADQQILNFRLDSNMSVVFQIIYDIKLETHDKIYNSKFIIGEFLYLPKVQTDPKTL